MSLTLETLQTQIPSYLTEEAKENLVRALDNFPQVTNYYTSLYQDEILQGDGWSPLELIRIEDSQKKSVKGIIISNSCDIDSQNRRHIPPNFVFSPIVKLRRYLSRFQDAGVNKDIIQNKENAIREQRATTLFYLPKGAGLDEDYVALLDDLHTLSVSTFQAQTERQKLFTLNQIGFYIFLFKLSVHFCRFHEGVNRG